MYSHVRNPGRDSANRLLLKRRCGGVAFEFAAVAPVFLLMLFAGIEFSMLNTIRSTASNAAYEAARKLVVPGASAEQGIEEAERIMAIVGVHNLTVTVTPSHLDHETQEVTVGLSIPYASNAVITPLFTGSVVIDVQARLHTERYGGVAP